MTMLAPVPLALVSVGATTVNVAERPTWPVNVTLVAATPSNVTMTFGRSVAVIPLIVEVR